MDVDSITEENVELETSPVIVSAVTIEKQEQISSLYSSKEMEKFSKLHRLVRVTAWVMRAGRAFRKLLKKYKDEEVSPIEPGLPKVDISINEKTKVQIHVLSTDEIFSA